MSAAPRRIFLYWLMLLLPTLAVGGGAMLLLRREQARLEEQGAQAAEAGRAAMMARARLIAENVELLVGDVQTGLLDALAAEPATGLEPFMSGWERTNPLVRVAFRAPPEGRMLRPEARGASEEAHGFLQRFARRFGDRPPWSVAALELAPAAAAAEPEAKREEQRESERAREVSALRQGMDKNIAQVQSARRDVQELFKPSNANAPYPGSSDTSGSASADAYTGADARTALADRASSRGLDRADVASAPGASVPAPGSAARSKRRTASDEARDAVAPAPAAELSRVTSITPERRGWAPTTVDGRLQLLGWVQPGGAGEVRGVEVQVGELVRRLGAALPAEASGGEGYALRDDRERVLHRSAAGPAGGEPAFRVPLAAALLPGWDVAAYAPVVRFGSEGGFLGAGMLLVGIFVATILAGGSLLLWQARRSEAEAAQKTSFVANVSHEFKTPLTTIRLYSELLEQGRVRDAAQGGEFLRTIGRETRRLARLVNNALDFSRLEQGRKKYARESFDLAAEIGRLLDTHAPRVAEAGLALQRELPDPPAPVVVMADRDALEQIVINLIDNACKYAAAGGEVTVVVCARAQRGESGSESEIEGGGGVEVRVGDRGPGVPAEHRERIFEKFHRVDDALTAEKTGAGLGLSIARQLARGMGGELRYRAREGGGAEFVLKLR